MQGDYALEVLPDSDLDLVTGGSRLVGPINVSVQTTVGVAVVGAIIQITRGGTSIVNITGVNQINYSY